MWCVNAIEICCASNQRKTFVNVIQQYCCVYSKLLFLGDGWLALVPTHLSYLRYLLLFGCDKVHGEYVEELVAAVPQLEVFK